ncbi:hypothetical protein UL498_002141 [Neisseria gonorrhoeae]|nr:hypothetical protein DT75_10980 [Neisseria gonorrhoeae]
MGLLSGQSLKLGRADSDDELLCSLFGGTRTCQKGKIPLFLTAFCSKKRHFITAFRRYSMKNSGKNTHAALLAGLGRAAALQALPLRLLASLNCGLENFEIRTPIGLLSDYGYFDIVVSS